jgi:N-glycosylase/DNA lyase
MKQLLYIRRGDAILALEYPNATTSVLDDIQWGRADELLTPAFWAYRCAQQEDRDDSRRFRTAATLPEEFAVCMLAGYGVPAEVGIAAAGRLRDARLLSGRAKPTPAEIEGILREPLILDGRPVRYRFYRTKSRYLSAGLIALAYGRPPEHDALAFRAWFDRLPGVGPKTASFITRNWLGSDDVAILDVHIVRACQIIGLFPRKLDLARDYLGLERRFLQLARGLGVRASWLDAVMWDDMRALDDDIIERALGNASDQSRTDMSLAESTTTATPAP